MSRRRRYLLDTATAQALFSGPGPADGHMEAATRSDVCISAISYGELCGAVASEPGNRALKRLLREFVQRVPVLPWDEAAAKAYGDLRVQCLLSGREVGLMDTLAGAHALANGAVFVTADPVLSRLDNPLETQNWLIPIDDDTTGDEHEDTVSR